VIANDIITYIIAGNGYFSNMMMDGTNLGDFDGYNNSYVDQQSQTMQVSCFCLCFIIGFNNWG
jgi:hypothetical protein